MSVVTQSVLRTARGAEQLRPSASRRTLAIAEQANESLRRFVMRRLGALLGERLVTAAQSPSLKWELIRGAAASKTIGFTRSELTQCLSQGTYRIADPTTTREDTQVEMVSPDGTIPGHVYGNQLEPSGSLFKLDTFSAWGEVERGATLSVRYIDLYWRPLALISDDLTTISGATTFAKLFVTGGYRSTSGRHSDPTDVVVIVLEGSKHFLVLPPASVNAKGLDRILTEGDVLLLPSPWEHLVTPIGQVCAHVTFGIMHFEYWRKTGLVPTHLGCNAPCENPIILAGLIPPKNPPSFIAPVTGKTLIRTAIPGGFVPIRESSGTVSVLGAGRLVSMTHLELRVLATAHALGVVTVRETAERVELSVDECTNIIEDLARAELVGAESPSLT